MSAAKITDVHDAVSNGLNSVDAGADCAEVAPSRVSRLRDVEARRAWAARLLQEALEASNLSQRAAANHAGFGRAHLGRLLAGEAPLAFGDLQRLPRRLAEQLLVRALAEVRATTPAVPRAPIQLAVAALDVAQEALRDAVAGRRARDTLHRLIAIAEEWIALEGMGS